MQFTLQSSDGAGERTFATEKERLLGFENKYKQNWVAETSFFPSSLPLTHVYGGGRVIPRQKENVKFILRIGLELDLILLGYLKEK